MRSKINFSLYDNSGDGVVEFTFMIFAGIATKNSIDGKTFWPHANTLGELGVLLSGKKIENGPYIKRYACANEIEYEAYKKNISTNTLSGVGVFIHEFSHLLGFPDYYSHNGNKTLDSWSVMDQGDHNCPSNIDYVRSCAPPLYSAFDRKFMEWLTPIEIKSSGTIRLDKLDGNVAYSITNPENRDEMYLLEYSSNKGWDVGQKNSGMLIWHIDYVDSIWTTMVNSKEWHMHVDIIEAKENNYDSSPSDVFPGSANVTEFNKFVFWNGLDMNITLSDITESPDKEYVTFNVTMGEPFMRELSSSSQLWIEPFFSSSSKTTLYYISYSKIVEDSIESIVVPKNSSQHIRVISQNGIINIHTPLSGAKTVRMFSLNGQLLFETTMDGSELQFQWPKRLGRQKAVLSVTQGNVNLFMGVISGL
jgi:M6 family metalloprotease-like protein